MKRYGSNMINLIPPAKRRELRAMRHNSILARYAMISIVFFAVTIFIHFGTYLLLKQAEVANSEQSELNMSKAQEYEGINIMATEYQRNLAMAKQLFESSIPYPEALSNLAKTLPAGVILNNVTLQADVIDKPGTLTAHATSYQTAVDLKNALTASPIATDVSISSVTNTAASGSGESQESGSRGESTSTLSQYPIQITLNVTFTRQLLYPQEELPAGDYQPSTSPEAALELESMAEDEHQSTQTQLPNEASNQPGEPNEAPVAEPEDREESPRDRDAIHNRGESIRR